MKTYVFKYVTHTQNDWVSSLWFVWIWIWISAGFQIHTRSFCTEITMPETRLCDDNLPIIEIVEVSQYDFTGDEYPGRPCVYSGSDCGRAISHNMQLYKDILTHCDGERTCGGFYITSVAVCSGRFGDYMTISFRCSRDDTATTIASPTSIMASSPTTQEATTPSNTTPTSATIESPVKQPNTTPTSAITETPVNLLNTSPTSGATDSPVNPSTNPAVTDVESKETITDRNTVKETNKTELYAGAAVGGVVSVLLVIVIVAVCVKRKRHTESKRNDTNDGDTPAAIQTNGGEQSSRLHTPGEQQSSRLHTPSENDIVLEQIVTDNHANEASPEHPAQDRMTADNPAVSQHDPDLAERDSPVGENPGQEDTTLLAAPTADTEEDWGYSSVGAATSAPTPSSKEPKYDEHRNDTVPATTQQPVDTNHPSEPDVYATVRKDKPHTSDVENEAPARGATKEDDYSLATETDVYAAVEKDRNEEADDLVIVDNPLYA